jgi:hypothetical protein
MGLGPFADMNKTEFIATKMGLNTSELRPDDWNMTSSNTSTNSGSGGISPMSTTTTVTIIPDAVNWVAERRVVPIKDQGQVSNAPPCSSLQFIPQSGFAKVFAKLPACIVVNHAISRACAANNIRIPALSHHGSCVAFNCSVEIAGCLLPPVPLKQLLPLKLASCIP